MVRATKIIYKTEFVGGPKLNNFALEEEELPALNDGEVLVKGEYHAVDPYNTAFMQFLPVGSTIVGGQIARVVESKHTKFPVGTQLYGNFGWRTHTIFNPSKLTDLMKFPTYVLPDFGELSVSLGLGALGMPGVCAYFGLLDVCKPKAGEVVVVSGAAGGIGHIVGQIAKLKGCKVIGFAGTETKCKWLTEELGFDHAINYKDPDVVERLRAVAPNGIDCYFDNVGGELSCQVIYQMNEDGRMSICGSLSSFTLDFKNLPKLSDVMLTIFLKGITVKGFHCNRYNDRWLDGIADLTKWIQEGKIKFGEEITVGFEKLPQAAIDMLAGKYVGKIIVKA